MKTVVLIRERRSDNQRIEDTFTVPYCTVDVEGLFRAAIEDYLKTDEGRESVLYTDGTFSWGDAMNEIPDEILEKYEIRYDETSEVLIVNQDEILFPEYQQQVLEEDEEE